MQAVTQRGTCQMPAAEAVQAPAGALNIEGGQMPPWWAPAGPLDPRPRASAAPLGQTSFGFPAPPRADGSATLSRPCPLGTPLGRNPLGLPAPPGPPGSATPLGVAADPAAAAAVHAEHQGCICFHLQADLNCALAAGC